MEQGVTRNMKMKSVRTEVSAPATTAEKGTPGYADTTASSDTASLDRAVPIAIKWKESV